MPKKYLKGGIVPGDGDPRHGTHNGYVNLKCRCQLCKTAWSAWYLEARERRHQRLLADPSLATHGKATTYSNWKCRCRPCTDAFSAASREQARRRRERKATPKLTATDWMKGSK